MSYPRPSSLHRACERGQGGRPPSRATDRGQHRRHAPRVVTELRVQHYEPVHAGATAVAGMEHDLDGDRELVAAAKRAFACAPAGPRARPARGRCSRHQPCSRTARFRSGRRRRISRARPPRARSSRAGSCRGAASAGARPRALRRDLTTSWARRRFRVRSATLRGVARSTRRPLLSAHTYSPHSIATDARPSESFPRRTA